MITEDLADYLQVQGKGTKGSNILGYHQDSPDECIILSLYDSREGFYHEASGHTADEHVFVQVMVRGKNATAVYNKALELHGLLHIRHGVLNGKKYFSMQCLQRPTPIGKDEQDRHRFTFNVEIHRPQGGA
jgi:hypothetical protein